MRLSPAILAPLALTVQLVSASKGDKLIQFKNCVKNCISVTCPEEYESSKIYAKLLPKGEHGIPQIDPEDQLPFDSLPLPWHLQTLQWSCEDNCDYQCQWYVTEDRIQEGESVVQFHGKWPFIRIAGIQEPASFVFSLLNFLAHYRGFQRLRGLKRPFPGTETEDELMLWYYKATAVVTMNAWVWSTVFHARDFTITERLDYFSAGLTVLWGLVIAVIRWKRLYTPENTLKRYMVLLTAVGMYAYHVIRLCNDWNYTYNMTANVVVAILQNIAWTCLCFENYRSMKAGAVVTGLPVGSKYAILNSLTNVEWSLFPLGLLLSVTLGMGLELFDFPPWWFTFDAHSLWHLATVVPGYLFYEWMVWDYKFMMYKRGRIE